ncbi:nucleoside hydrolase [Streptomyces sp. NEAU-Y11]|uniref:nucleoside hydrolase n=1 Tax=Streptomyces cucumeris TaxID=2962890 RepID=UPI0035AC1FF8
MFGNASVEQTTFNASRVLAMCDRDDVRVAKGAECPLVYPHPHRAEYAHGKDGLGGATDSLPAPREREQARPAVEVLAGVLKTAQAPVTIAAIGPMTNIALLLAVYPELRSRIGRLVVMGGATTAATSPRLRNSMCGGSSTRPRQIRRADDARSCRPDPPGLGE